MGGWVLIFFWGGARAQTADRTIGLVWRRQQHAYCAGTNANLGSARPLPARTPTPTAGWALWPAAGGGAAQAGQERADAGGHPPAPAAAGARGGGRQGGRQAQAAAVRAGRLTSAPQHGAGSARDVRTLLVCSCMCCVLHPASPPTCVCVCVCVLQESGDQMLDLQERLDLQEQRQQQMLGFLATAMQVGAAVFRRQLALRVLSAAGSPVHVKSASLCEAARRRHDHQTSFINHHHHQQQQQEQQQHNPPTVAPSLPSVRFPAAAAPGAGAAPCGLHPHDQAHRQRQA